MFDFMYFYLFIPMIMILGLLAYLAGKLTIPGSVAGILIALVLYIAFKFTGVGMLGGFFGIAVLATSVGYSRKVALGIAEFNQGRRNIWQVLANGGVAGIAAALALIHPPSGSILLLIAGAALAGAAADTVSSEIGSVYGKKFFNILSWRRDSRGADGVISWQGTFAGMIASAFIAMIYFLLDGNNNKNYALIIFLAGTIGNLADSALGATLERKEILNNNQVNFLCTLVAGLSAILLALLL